MVSDKIAIGNEVVMVNGSVLTKIGCDYRVDLLPDLATVRPGGVVHHVSCDQLVDSRAVTYGYTKKQLLNHILRIGCQQRILPAVELRVEQRWSGASPIGIACGLSRSVLGSVGPFGQ